jgi:hypothetical protein
MIEHGIDIKTLLEIGSSKIDLAMAHLLQYNFFTDFKESSPNSRHIKDRETPFPIFMGMSVYTKTRKKGLVEMLNEHGLSFPYRRVLEISVQLGDPAVEQFVDEGVVCPSTLRKGFLLQLLWTTLTTTRRRDQPRLHFTEQVNLRFNT